MDYKDKLHIISFESYQLKKKEKEKKKVEMSTNPNGSQAIRLIKKKRNIISIIIIVLLHYYSFAGKCSHTFWFPIKP